MLDNQLRQLRVTVRKGIPVIIDFIDSNFLTLRDREKFEITPKICMFCGSDSDVTNEHIIPRWAFEKDAKKFFNITINGHARTYERSAIPACRICNNERLNALERYIQDLFEHVNPKKYPYGPYECENIIRWLEIIDYKFHVMNAVHRFLSPVNGPHIPLLKDIPLIKLLEFREDLPFNAKVRIRKTLMRTTVKSKATHLNSLLIFTTTNKGFHFFHKLDDFIFIELPKFGVAVFYFYSKVFKSTKDAQEEAMKIIDDAY
ncbi:hypothetical protein [Parapedobacter sp.]